MSARKKRIKTQEHQYVEYGGDISDPDDIEAKRSKIRDANKEFAKRMTILQSWSEFWTDYTVREGDAYPQLEAREIIKKSKKITCPIANCNKSFTSIGGLKYHYARCNLELSFKCKVCRPQFHLTTRGELLRHLIFTHYEQLPELTAEQKLIADSYLSSERKINDTKERRRDKKGEKPTQNSGSSKRKYLTDCEPTQNPYSLIKSFNALNERVFLSNEFENRPFKDWYAFGKDWEPVLHEIERRRYYPPELESMHFKVANSRQWSRLKTGQSIVLTKDKQGIANSSVIYTGGINSSIAWLPKPMLDKAASGTTELVAIAVNCHSMDKSVKYIESKDGTHCIQFWTVSSIGDGTQPKEKTMLKMDLSYMVGHNNGIIFDMLWCPLGSSWQAPTEVQSRVGLLALACGDGQIRILSVPHTQALLSRAVTRTSENFFETLPIFRAKPIAVLMPPGVGPSSAYKNVSCSSICWGLENNQRIIVAGYANGNVALFDLANGTPIVYANAGHRHIYQPLKCWTAHGAPVTGVAISSISFDRTLVATGSTDRLVKVWKTDDLSSCLTNERAPITGLLWDYRLRGIVSASESAFTSFHNRVRYRFNSADGINNTVVTSHRTTVWGLSGSLITSAIATADQAGEVFVVPNLTFRQNTKKNRNLISHSLYTMRPRPLSVARLDSSSQDNKSNTEEEEEDRQDSDDEEGSKDDDEDQDDEEDDIETDFENAERGVANKPTKFLLPLDKPAVETYIAFKNNFGLEFIHYKNEIRNNARFPESALRANDIKNIYCDRHCDYPFSTINSVAWSPNVKTYSYLLSGMRSGLCRLDRVQIIENNFEVAAEASFKKTT